MPASLPVPAEAGAVAAAGRAGPLRRLLLQVMCASLAFYPLGEQFLAPVIAVSFLMGSLCIGWRWLQAGPVVPRRFVNQIWLAYALVYGVWFAVGLLHGNRLSYITQDSLGFALYLVALPVLFLYTHYEGLGDSLRRFVVGASVVISVASVAVVSSYHLLFGAIDSASILLTNAFLAGLGLSWNVDQNSGLLGMYTNAGHLLLLGIAVVAYEYSRRPRAALLWLIVLFEVGVVLDGHRALVLVALLQAMMLVRPVMRQWTPQRKLAVAAVVLVLVSIGAALSLAWISQRFDFSAEDPSTLERHAQIPALLDKIAENPVMGSGFGSVAAYIRSDERPFSYEVDFLATAMKLGLVGCAIYFGAYFYALLQAGYAKGRWGYFLLSAGLPFFIYMGTNGNQAMSTDSAVFHILLFLLIAFQSSQPRSDEKRLPAATGAA